MQSAPRPPSARPQRQTNNPLARTTALNFQNQHTGELTGLDKDANQFFLRYAQLFVAFGGNWIARLTVPLNSFQQADGGTKTGRGDSHLFSACLFGTGNPAMSFGISSQITVPCATDDALGAQKWALGLADVLLNAENPMFQWG